MARLIALTLVLVLAATPAAVAQTTATGVIERAARALEDDPVYVDPDAEADFDEAAANRIRERIRERGAGPMYVAVLPAEAADEAGGEAGAVGAALADQLNREGTYAIVVGNKFRAGATRGILERGQAGQLAREALDAQGRNGVEPTLLDFVDRVGEARRGGQGSESGSQGGGSSADPGGGPSGGLLLALLAGGAGLFALSRWRRRRRQQEQVSSEMEEVRETARDDLVALGEDIRALDLDAEMPNADPSFKRDYEEAVRCYQTASQGLELARRPEDLEAVSSALEEGRYAMASAKARLEGREPPERRPPCFFDPRHGPSTRDVEWSPPDGQPRLVPACEADALRLEEGQEPATREVMVGGQSMPYYMAGPAYGPWAGGFFGGLGGGLLPGFLMGSMLGGGLGFPDHAYGHEGGEGDFGGGDFGGGGLDVGDFGGGDFGGGDFGGGDFGGGE